MIHERRNRVGGGARAATRLAHGLALAAALAGDGCAGRSQDACPRSWSPERCAWTRAEARRADARGETGGGTRAFGEPVAPREPGWSEAEDILDAAVDHFAAGLPETLIEHALLTLCEKPPGPEDVVGASAWACRLANPPRLGGFEFTLELNDAGVVALHSSGMSGGESARLLAAARLRWSPWCDGRGDTPPSDADARGGAIDSRRQPAAFRPIEDTAPDVEFERCTLPEGPTLMLGRFPENFEDLDSDVWHVSVSIMGPG